ncbi:MAG: hypothetical protein JNL58_03540 [Planctomyces sp.]|nr:hypothetical protein [Planctomyces sp.]
MNRDPGIWGVLLIALAMAGCQSEAESVGVDHQDDEQHDGDHHEDEHNEHFVPAHKPANLEGAVNELRRRIPEAAGGQDAVARQELFDVVLWIPELAADSDLRKKDWERAAEASRRLHEVCTKACSAEGSPEDRKQLVESTQPLINELAELLTRVELDLHRQPGDNPTRQPGDNPTRQPDEIN